MNARPPQRQRLTRLLVGGVAALAAAALASCSVGPGGSNGSRPVDASSYPSESIELVVPYEAGGATDQLARALVEPAAADLGSESMVVINQPGASGTIGTTRVVAASPDGYTLGLVAGGPLTVQPHYGRTIYTTDDVTPVARISVSPIVLVVRADSPFRTIEDVIEAARTTPGSFRYASTGTGNPANLAMESLDTAADIETTQVPFDSSSEATTAVLGGNVEGAAGQPSGFRAGVRSGDLRVLANLGSVKDAELADVPTLQDLGYDAATNVTSGVIAPKGLPQPYLDELSAAFRAALDNPKVREQIELTGAVPRFGTPEEYAADIEREYTATGEVLRATGLI